MRGSRLAQPAIPHIDQLTTEDTEKTIIETSNDKSLDAVSEMQAVKIY